MTRTRYYFKMNVCCKKRLEGSAILFIVKNMNTIRYHLIHLLEVNSIVFFLNIVRKKTGGQRCFRNANTWGKHQTCYMSRLVVSVEFSKRVHTGRCDREVPHVA